MNDWTVIVLRLGLYLDLMLLFGLVGYTFYAGGPSPSVRGRATTALLAAFGITLSIAGFAFLIARMTGADLDQEMVRFVLWDTAPGVSFLVRATALIVVGGLAFSMTHRFGRWLTLGGAGVTLATLAWSGHAAVTERSAGTLHRIADVVHLFAASAWLGALAML